MTTPLLLQSGGKAVRQKAVPFVEFAEDVPSILPSWWRRTSPVAIGVPSYSIPKSLAAVAAHGQTHSGT
jgi:hypothetical protein